MELDFYGKNYINEKKLNCQIISIFIREVSEIIYQYQSKVNIIMKESKIIEHNNSKIERKVEYPQNSNHYVANLEPISSNQELNPKKIYYFPKANIKEIFLLGNFTEKKWEEKVPLLLNPSSKYYESICTLREGAEFNLYVNNSKKILLSYKTNKEKTYNIFSEGRSKKHFSHNNHIRNIPFYTFQNMMTPYKLDGNLMELVKSLFEKILKSIILELVFEIYDFISISTMLESQIFHSINSTFITNFLKDNLPKKLASRSASFSNNNFFKQIIADKILESLISSAVNFFASKIAMECCPTPIFKLICKAKSVPKKDDAEENEDAYLFNERAIGVADGVSGWNKFGITAKNFSNELITNCFLIINNLIGNSIENVEEQQPEFNPLSSILFSNNSKMGDNNFTNSNTHNIEATYIDIPDTNYLIEEAFHKIINFGSSTILLAIINKNIVKVSALGDTKLVYLKYNNTNKLNPYSEKLATNCLMHSLDTPFQLAKVPTFDFILQKKAQLNSNSVLIQNLNFLEKKIKEHSFEEDKISSAEKYIFYVNEWDIILIGSDGLFDNLFNYEIIEIINKLFRQKGFSWVTTEEFADKIVNEVAYEVHKVMHSSLDRRKIPFQETYKKIFHKTLLHGKEDDATLVVAIISKDTKKYQI